MMAADTPSAVAAARGMSFRQRALSFRRTKQGGAVAGLEDTLPAWHSMSADEILAHFGLSGDVLSQGLSDEAAALQRERFGPNRPSPPYRPGLLRRMFAEVNNMLMYILVGALVANIALLSWIPAIFVGVIIAVNVAIGIIQQGRATKAAEALSKLLAPRCTAFKSGRLVQIESSALVPGDVVVLESGDLVPADLRLIDASGGLHINESALTGEAEPVVKSPPPLPATTPLAERTCMAWSGTLVTHGLGRGVVVATGNDTQLGRISRLVGETKPVPTGLVVQLEIFGRWLAALVIILAVSSYFVITFGRGRSGQMGVQEAANIAVGAVPQSLPTVVTVTLALSITFMAHNRAIIRQLPAVETLGSVTVICSDKTGTLTKNEMTVVAVVSADGGYDVTGTGYDPQGEVIPITPCEDESPSDASGARSSDSHLQQMAAAPSAVRQPSAQRRVNSAALSVEAARVLLLGGVLCNTASLVPTPMPLRVQVAGVASAATVAAAEAVPIAVWEPENVSHEMVAVREGDTSASAAGSGVIWTPRGDPTEVALLTAAVKAGLLPQCDKAAGRGPAQALLAQYPRQALLPFDSSHKFMACVSAGVDWARSLSLVPELQVRSNVERRAPVGFEAPGALASVAASPMEALPHPPPPADAVAALSLAPTSVASPSSIGVTRPSTSKNSAPFPAPDGRNNRVLFVKGAPDRLLPRCAYEAVNVTASSFDLATLRADWWARRVRSLSSKGLRVLALCAARWPDVTTTTTTTTIGGDGSSTGNIPLTADVITGPPAPFLTLLCLVAILDPPRDEVVLAVAECEGAGECVRVANDSALRSSLKRWQITLLSLRRCICMSLHRHNVDTSLCRRYRFDTVPLYALASAAAAGIAVKMITGDAKETATAIAETLGILQASPLNPSPAAGTAPKDSGTQPTAALLDDAITADRGPGPATGTDLTTHTTATALNVLTGQQLDEMGDEQLSDAVHACNVFARTTPHHKLRIVRALQSRGHIVAMTGDGVNDSPALKAANIGARVTASVFPLPTTIAGCGSADAYRWKPCDSTVVPELGFLLNGSGIPHLLHHYKRTCTQVSQWASPVPMWPRRHPT